MAEDGEKKTPDLQIDSEKATGRATAASGRNAEDTSRTDYDGEIRQSRQSGTNPTEGETVSNSQELEGSDGDNRAERDGQVEPKAEETVTDDGFSRQNADTEETEATVSTPHPKYVEQNDHAKNNNGSKQHPFSPNRLLLAAAGADPEWFLKNKNASEEERKLRNQGLIICITASFAALSSYYFFSSFFDDGTYVGAIAGPVFTVLLTIVWAAVIFAVDRAMLMTMLGSEGRKLVPALSRLILAAAIGIIIAHPLKVQIFAPEIQSSYETMRAEFFSARDERLRIERSSQMAEIVSQFPDPDLVDGALEIEQAILRRRGELEILDAARLFELSGANEIYIDDENLHNQAGRVISFTLPLLTSPIEVSVSTFPANADPRNRSEVENECRTARAADESQAILRDVHRQYNSLVQLNNGQDHRVISAVALGATPSTLTAFLLENRRYVPGGASAGSGGLLNCDLFAWARTALISVINDYESELRSLGIPDRNLAEFRTGLQSIQRLNEIALTSQRCIVPMRNYSVADQERDDADARNLNDGDLASIRSRIFDPFRDPNTPLSSQEFRWVSYICAQDYPDLSFMWRTAILFDLASNKQEGSFLGTEIYNWVDEDAAPEPPRAPHGAVNSKELLSLGIFPPSTAAIASIAITLLFVLVEILPLLSKLYSRPGPYELSVAHKNRQAAIDFAEHKESPQEAAERRSREADTNYDEKYVLQTREATMAFRGLILQKKAELAVSDLPEDVIRERLRGLDKSLEDFILDNNASDRT
ncbi:DUF4407 domain-containing protein [Fluviibacterium sp. S390]|uniref:DUF4407 domain-containing protein n=1 Tax=Fluviibacterium sp. S390 TaxID=3415139 RepID=UPI003C7AAF4D